MNDLLNQLDQAYRELRKSWFEDWAGLARVVSGAVQWLCGASAAGADSNHSQFVAVLMACAQQVEVAGRSPQLQGSEPPYHNRLHIADTVVGMTVLLRARRLGAGERPMGHPLTIPEFQCLAAMLLHDYGHDGRVNEFPRQIEKASIDLFSAHAARCGLDAEDWELIQRLILETDPRFVAEVHSRAAAHAASPACPDLSFEEMAVLVVEADVLASALKFPGEDLTLSLIQEWTKRYPDRARQLSLPRGRLGFLRFGARFSSPAALMLGVPKLIDDQIESLSLGA